MSIVISGVNNNDKITASDGTIDLLSGVTYGSEITVPSLKLGSNIQLGNAGIITATSFSGTTGTFGDFVDVGSNIQLGNAGVATATTFVGNLTGNVNATSNLLLQIGGSEKFRVGSSGQLGIGGANYGTSGQVLTSGGSGSAATWSTIPTSDADKITEGNTKAEVSDTGTNGRFFVEIEGTERFSINSIGYATFSGAITQFQGATFAQDVSIVDTIKHTGDTNTRIRFPENDTISFQTAGSERLRILSTGGVGINTSNFSGQLNNEVGLAVHGSSNDNCRISITTPTKSNSRLGYYGLSNRFGIDVHYGFEIRDAESSYATRFKINNNGIVSMPFQPLVRYAGSWSYTSWNSHAQVVWGGENEDIGGNFSNGVFTVPSGGEGVYVITAQFIGPNPGSNYFLWQFYKNTTGLNEWVQGYSTNGNAEASSATIAVSCSVGDTLRVAFHTSYQYAYTSGYSTFSIFKVH